MSIRTVVEFNNDLLDDLRRDGHISEYLFQHLLAMGPRRESLDIPGVVTLIQLHHSVDYSITFDGFDFERHETVKERQSADTT